MDEVKVKKSELLETVKKNRESHQALYQEAVKGYRIELINHLKNRIKDLEAEKIIGSIQVTLPEDHTAEYDQVIKMLEMSVDDEITLSQHEFKQYVMDEWTWMPSVLATHNHYSNVAKMQRKK